MKLIYGNVVGIVTGTVSNITPVLQIVQEANTFGNADSSNLPILPG